MFSQEFDPVKNITPAAPTAAQFQKYGDIPVSYYTGTPSIDIPLYTIQSFDIVVPISMSYHASGVKLTEMASWVGTGWSLSAGGMLSRSVRGKPDFTNYVDDQLVGSYFEGPSIPTTLGSGNYNYIVDITTQQKDVQPDEYYINFLGRSVKFYINQDEEVIVDPSSRVKVEKPTSSNQYWVVTDASGVKYTFGSNTSSREISKFRVPFTGGHYTQDYVSSWYLTKIVSPTGHEVNFNYTIASSFTHIPNQRHHNSYTLLTDMGDIASLCRPPGYDYQHLTLLKGGVGLPNEFKPVRLSSITYDKGGDSYTAEFISDNARADAYDDVDHEYLNYYKLMFLHIKNEASKKLSYVFNYDNLSNGLWLTSLNKVSYNNNGFDGGIEETHVFEYFNHAQLPSSLSYDVDYWGMYNGAGNGTSTTLIPQSLDYPNGVDRDYNFNYAKYGILTKITYPTGGYTEFEYEPHTIAPNDEVVGGLRLKKVTSSDKGRHNSNPDVVRTFVYKNPSSNAATGVRSAPFVNSYGTRYYNKCGKTYQSFDVTAISTHSANGSGFMSIGYPIVQELFGENGENGRNVYHYSHTSSPLHEASYPPVGYEDIFSPIYFNSLTNGRLLKKITERKNGASYEKISEVENTYQTVVNSSDYIQGLAVSLAVDGTSYPVYSNALNQIGQTNFSDLVTYLPYRIKPDWVKLTKTVERNYEGGATPIVKTTDFTKTTYGDRWFHDFETEIKTTYGVSGTIEKTFVNFPFNPVSATIVTTNMRDNYIMMPLRTISIEGNGTINSSTVLGGSSTTYNWVSGAPLADSQYQITSGLESGSGGDEVFLGKFNSYNSDGLPTEVEDAGGHLTGIVWYEDIMLAACQNAGAGEFYYQGFEYSTGMATLNPHTGKFYKSGDYTVSFTPAAGRAYEISYWYLSGSSWVLITKDYTGASMALTEGSAIDDVRIYPKDAIMTTYTADSFYGVTSQSGPDNRPIYYIYDAAGRLKLLKDLDGNIIQAYDYQFLSSTSQE